MTANEMKWNIQSDAAFHALLDPHTENTFPQITGT